MHEHGRAWAKLVELTCGLNRRWGEGALYVLETEYREVIFGIHGQQIQVSNALDGGMRTQSFNQLATNPTSAHIRPDHKRAQQADVTVDFEPYDTDHHFTFAGHDEMGQLGGEVVMRQVRLGEPAVYNR